MAKTVNQRFLAIVFGAISALILIGLIGVLSTQRMADDLEFTDESIIRSLAILSGIERDFLLIRVNALYHLSYAETAKKAPHEATIRRNITETQSLLDEYQRTLVVNQRDKELIEQDIRLFKVYLAALEKVLHHSNANQREAAVVVVESEWKPAGESLTTALAQHAHFKEQFVEQAVQRSMQSGRRQTWMIILLTLLGVAGVLVAAYFFRKSLAATAQPH
ncbi:MCP four helix bundle domain-containing protein [Chitinibacter sp. GC72]|uniref:MCP four helix bundle domain-containing protein n=1 Tax=Chitinibacter sp. GC72 TaxID=1526917 RepID=UPI0012F8D715|nr:MCP four helix bundle domain-containing protein [Chitinibacter sp. GC72]